MLSLAGILALSGCSSDANSGNIGESTEGSRELGGLGLALLLPDGSNVNDPTYTITRTSDPAFSLTGPLTITGNVASGTITGLPAGDDYRVVLSATRSSPTGAPPCTGEATFTVIAAQTTIVNVVLQCDDTSAAEGNVTINGTFNICPRIGSTTATPTTAAVGTPINLTATATDKDMADVVAFTWSSADGTFANANAANTTYTCASVGTKTISLSVTDGPARGCTKTLTTPISITCTEGSAVDAGPGEVDAGPGEVDAGPGEVDAGPGEVDAGPGEVDAGPGEVDAGPGEVDAGPGEVDAGPGTSARFGTAACDTCITSQCNPYFDVLPLLAQCVDATCEATFACFQRNHCATDLATVNRCYCGQVTNDACLVPGYVANGPCAALGNAAFGTTDASVVLGSIYGENTSTGNGGALFQCAAELCPDVCVNATDIPAP